MLRASEPAATTRTPRAAEPAVRWAGDAVYTELVLGRRAVLDRLPALVALAEYSGQAVELTDLPYFFARPSRLRYRPTLVLVYRAQKPQPEPHLMGAALLYEVCLSLPGSRSLWRSGIYTAGNRRGLRTIFAPVEQRVEMAARAAQVLLEHGARFVNVDVDLGFVEALASGTPEANQSEVKETHPKSTRLRQARALAGMRLSGVAGMHAEWALEPGLKRFDLKLERDFDSTVATLGKHTRRNLRAFPRKCTDELGCRFVPRVEITREQFLALNREFAYPSRRREGVAAWRYESLTRFPEVFLSGMQASDGRWMSLIAGRRRRGEVAIDWQMNRQGYERLSLATAMRSLLLAREITLGSTSLSFEGGTRHPMAECFRMRSVYNLAVRRPSWVLEVLGRLLPRLAAEQLLTRALVKSWRRWLPCWKDRPPVG